MTSGIYNYVNRSMNTLTWGISRLKNHRTAVINNFTIWLLLNILTEYITSMRFYNRKKIVIQVKNGHKISLPLMLQTSLQQLYLPMSDRSHKSLLSMPNINHRNMHLILTLHATDNSAIYVQFDVYEIMTLQKSTKLYNQALWHKSTLIMLRMSEHHILHKNLFYL